MTGIIASAECDNVVCAARAAGRVGAVRASNNPGDRARPRGESALRRELAQKGVARQVVDEILGERLDAAGDGDPNLAAATALLERKRAALARESDERKRRQKAYALLARSGFDPETCRTVSAAVTGDAGETDDDAHS